MSQLTETSAGTRRFAAVPRLVGEHKGKQPGSGSPGTAVIAKTKPQTKRPNLYRVLLLNDDYTPMEFVVQVLECFFHKDHDAPWGYTTPGLATTHRPEGRYDRTKKLSGLPSWQDSFCRLTFVQLPRRRNNAPATRYGMPPSPSAL
jgi:hypothetical protein